MICADDWKKEHVIMAPKHGCERRNSKHYIGLSTLTIAYLKISSTPNSYTTSKFGRLIHTNWNYQVYMNQPHKDRSKNYIFLELASPAVCEKKKKPQT